MLVSFDFNDISLQIFIKKQAMRCGVILFSSAFKYLSPDINMFLFI